MREKRLLLKSVFVLAILLTVMSRTSPLFAHSVESAGPHRHGNSSSPLDQSEGVGIDERLGAKIPLGLVFRDEGGKPVRLSELITGPTIILPVYYGCTNVCNFLQGGLARVLPMVKSRPGIDYRVISVSFDETETPELAARYKRMYLSSMNAPFPEEGWRFLTGDAAAVRSLTDAAGYRFKRNGRDFIHPVVSMVVSGDGTIVRYLYGTDFLAKDLGLALLEARQGKVGATVRKMVGYCFSYDPAGKTYVFNLLRVSATVVILSTGSFLLFLLLTGRRRKKRRSEEK